MSASQYFSDIFRVAKSICIGMSITLKYFVTYKKNLCTVQYPKEREVIPPRHRGIHYLETEKCVMCWKCSDICPVDCIYIEGARGADGVLEGGYRGQKATLAKFTVDYTVCIFCGLCEEPCPTKCIWLGPDFDYHSTDRTMMEKNLLTDAVYTEEDEKFVDWARGENERLQGETKRRQEEEKAKQAAEKEKEQKKGAVEKGKEKPKGDSQAKKANKGKNKS